MANLNPPGFRVKIGLLIAAICISLAALEAFLRLLGGGYVLYRLGFSHKEQGRTVVLCMGDSFTFGSGAPRGFSYPEQLSGLLELACRKKLYTVYNEGRPGMNSSQLLDRLEDSMRLHPPIW